MSFMKSFSNLPCHIKTFSNNKVIVLPENFDSIKFAQKLAEIKNFQVVVFVFD